MTPEELQEVVAAVIAALKTNGKTIDQLTAVTALANSDNLEVSGGKKISFGKLKEIVAADVTVSAEEIKGYVVIESTDDLPEDPTQEEQMKGYILDTMLYIYVGTGGDTLDGKYRSIQLKGEDGTPGAQGPKGDKGDSGVDLGEVVLVNDLTTGGEGSALSAEMGKVLGITNVGELAKNLFSIDGWQDKYYLPNATGSTNNNWDTTGYINIENGKTYSFRIGTKIPTSVYNYYTLWDENKSYLGLATYDTSTGTLTINNANAKYLRISIYGNGASYAQDNGTSIKRAHTKFFIMFNEGASPLAFDVFGTVSIKSTIKSDYVKDTIMVDKRNLFDWDNYVTGNIVDGVYTSTGNYKVTPFIDVSMYGEMLLQWCKNGSNNSSGVLFAYDENQNPLFTIPCPYNSTGGYLVPHSAKYVRGYNINLLLTLAIGQAIPDKLYEPTPKINVDYIPFLSRLEGKTIAFLGDSFTAMATYPNTAFTLLQSAKQFNWGANAWKYTALQSLLQSHQSDIPSLDAIVILGGANDFASSDGTAGLVTACKSLVSYIYSQNPTILILHLTPTYTYGYTPPSGTQRTDTDANGVHISQYAQAIKDTCDEIGVPVLDTYRTLGITQYNVASMTRDGLHPTEEVYKKMGWQVAKKLGDL